MDPQDAIDLGREAMKACLMVGGPILLASLVIGLLVGVLQAMTQVQDQTISFVPKLVCLMLVIGVCLPWLTDKMVDFSRETLATPMTHFHVSRFQHQSGDVHATPQPNDWGIEREVRGSTENQSGTAGMPDRLTAPTIQPVPIQRSPFGLPQFRTSRLPSKNTGG